MLSHPGETLTIYFVAESVGKAFAKAFTPMNIVSRFLKIGIFFLNPDIFTDSKFLGSAVTNRHSKSESIAESADSSPKTGSQLCLTNQQDYATAGNNSEVVNVLNTAEATVELELHLENR